MASGGQLKILIVGAHDLDRIVTADQQQPYYILECGNQRSRSKPCLDSGTNPTWNTAHKFNITDEVAVLAVIKDEGTKGVIGQGMIELPRYAVHLQADLSPSRSSSPTAGSSCALPAEATCMDAGRVRKRSRTQLHLVAALMLVLACCLQVVPDQLVHPISSLPVLRRRHPDCAFISTTSIPWHSMHQPFWCDGS